MTRMGQCLSACGISTNFLNLLFGEFCDVSAVPGQGLAASIRLVWMIPASGELNTAMPPVAMLPSLLGARAGVVSLIVVFVALAFIVLFLRLLAEAGDK
jgi:hypothetical protein